MRTLGTPDLGNGPPPALLHYLLLACSRPPARP